MPSKTGLSQDGEGQEQQTRACLCSPATSDTVQCVSLGDLFWRTQLLICKMLVGPQSVGSRLGDSVSSHGASLMAVSSGQTAVSFGPSAGLDTSLSCREGNLMKAVKDEAHGGTNEGFHLP